MCSLLLALLACAGPSGDTGKRPADDDTGPAEDTDTAGPEDTGPEDTGPEDTGPEDTGPEDTGPEDTGPVETDTDPDDTGPDDTGPPGELDLDVDADAKLIGEASVDWPVEMALATGDLDGDGVADVIVGYDDAPSGGDGTVYVVRGAPYGDVPLGAADVVLAGAGGEGAGHSVASGGDVDGDGIDDLVVGAPERGDAGRVYVLRGPLAGGARLADADTVLSGEYFDSEYGYFGNAGARVALDGDATGDGLADVLVGAPSAELLAGTFYVVPGTATGAHALADAVKVVGEPSANLGSSVAYVGDTDGDGADDLLVGQSNADPIVLLFRGPLTEDRSPSDADAAISPSSRWSRGGDRATGAGDVDADGYDDIVLDYTHDDEGGDDAGAAFVFLGPVASGALAGADAKLVGAAENDAAGVGLCGGDVDGDGRADLAVGALASGTSYIGPGAVHLVFGPVTGTVALADAPVTLRGGPGDWAGYAVACGDLDDDGRADLVTTGPGDDAGGTFAGAAWVTYAASLLP